MTKSTLADFMGEDQWGRECLTQDGLDNLWPMDDREPLTLDGKMPFHIPETCGETTPPMSVNVGHDALVAFVFDGDPLLPAVPLPGSLALMASLIVVLVIFGLMYQTH